MTIFNALLFGLVAMFILANLTLLVAAVYWAMGGFARFAKLKQPVMARATYIPRKRSLNRLR